MMNNIHKQNISINRTDRNALKGHHSVVVWFTGLSGSGKSTLANEVDKTLFSKGIHSYVLDGDNIRHGLNNDLGFSETDRSENIRRTAEVSKLMANAGIVTLVSFITPLRSDRKLAKAIIGEQDFIEVFIDTPIEVCEERDIKGLYAKARKGEIPNFTGISAPYEAPEHPDLIIKTADKTIASSADDICDYILKRINIQ